jgi:hypothetical protein
MNMMAEAIAPVELAEGEKYYVSSFGIFTYKGPVSRGPGLDVSSVSKQYRTGDAQLHRFVPDQVYSLNKKAILAPEPEIQQGKRVHALSKIHDLAEAMQIITQTPNRVETNDEYKLMTTNVIGLAQLIRDHKKHPDAIFLRAREAMSLVLSYHLEALPSEADEYLSIMTKTSQWPAGLPAMPISHQAMTAVIKRRQSREAFDAEFIASIGGKAVTPPQTVIGAPAVESPKPVVIPQALFQRQLSAVAPVPKPQIVPSAAALIELPGKAKFISPRGFDVAAGFDRNSGVYITFSKELHGTPAMKLVDAATGLLTTGEALDLSRLIFAHGTLNLGNMTMAKNRDLAAGERRWTSESVRDYFHALLEKVVARLGPDDLSVTNDLLEELDRKIGAPLRRASVPHTQKPVLSQAAAPPLPFSIRPAAEPSVEAPAVQPPAAAVAQAAPTHLDEAGVITGQFKIAIRRSPEEPDSAAVERELELAVRNEDQLPVALTAAKHLSAITFEIFSRVALRKQDVAVAAAQMGTDTKTICHIFEQAVAVVTDELAHDISVLKARAAESCHKNTLG